MTLVKNYQVDLQKSKTTPLLIELSKQDLNKLCRDDICGLNIAIDSARAIYDGVDELKNSTQSNIIYLDANKIKDMQHVFLFEVLLDILEDSIKNIKNLAIAKQGISSALSFVTGGILNAEIGSFLNDAVSSVVYQISEEVSDSLIDGIVAPEDISEQVSSLIEDNTFDFISDTSANFIDKVTNNNLYLTDASKKLVEKLSQQFKLELSPAESFTLVLEMLLALALEMPKMLFIKDPHKLDKDSLAILSLLFSFSKNAKDLGKHTGLSVVYAYDDESFQPYQEVDEKYKLSKQLLDEQRLFAQRYAMLERLTSNIPQIAVKSSVFVGREEELKGLKERYLYSKENKNINTLEVISAEPGVGKTKLVKKHFHQIRSEEQHGNYQIRLSLLNQIGHSSTNTGLSSLINSIVQEAARLETHKTLIKKSTEKIVDAVYNNVKSILGIDAFVDMSETIGDRVFLEGQLHRTKINTIGDLDNKPQKRKEEQFLKLNASIKELFTLSDENIPIVLFIDDLQWIDDDSAEYIVQHFIEKFNVHIVSTMRPSDATTALKQSYEFKEINKYKIALLEKVGIKTTKNSESEITNLQVDVIHLSGLNFTTLSSLIEQTIQGDIAYAKILANTIIKKLNNDKDKDEVNTLFAVEAINMLCDKKLYENQEIEQLILMDTPLRFNHEINNFQKALEETFTLLLKKYEKSLSHYNDTTNESEQKFNLMAYAVLEERLNILKIYFAEHGNAAVNTLLFSSLLGTPFNSKIVKNVLEAIATTDEELLQPLKEYILDGEQEITLTEMHYEIIEEVYEILSRYTQFENSYEYRHSLLNIFLEKQFKYQINSVFKNNRVKSKDKLYMLILGKIEEEEKLQSFNRKEELSLTFKEYEHLLLYLQSKEKIFKRLFFNHPMLWRKHYIHILDKISSLLNSNRDIKLAIQKQEAILNLITNDFDPIRIYPKKEYYLDCLNNLSTLYLKTRQIEKALEVTGKSFKYLQEMHLDDHSNYHFKYAVILNNLALCYSQSKELLDLLYSVDLFKQAMQILKQNQNLNPNEWIDTYTMLLNNLADVYKNTQLYDYNKVMQLELEAINLLDKAYRNNADRWAEVYVTALNNMGLTFLYNDNTAQSIRIHYKALHISEKYYTLNPLLWTNIHITCLNNLSGSLESKNLGEAVQLSRKAFEIGEKYIEENQETHMTNTFHLAELYFKNHELEKSLHYQKIGLSIQNACYKNEPGTWANEYVTNLLNYSHLAHLENNVEEAIDKQELALQIFTLFPNTINYKIIVMYLNSLMDIITMPTYQQSIYFKVKFQDYIYRCKMILYENNFF